MASEFKALKEKIQYLFNKIDSGESLLEVELDLLKAYTQKISQEIEEKGIDIFEPKMVLSEMEITEENVINPDEKIEETTQEPTTAVEKTEIKEEVPQFEEETPKIDFTEENVFEEEEKKEELLFDDEPEEDGIIESNAESKEENELEKEDTIETPSTNGTGNNSVDSEEDMTEDYGIGLKFKQSKPLKELIDLSEKYLFIQNLFGQDPDRFSKALRKMDESNGVEEALNILNEYSVDNSNNKEEAELKQKFKGYLKIRFSK